MCVCVTQCIKMCKNCYKEWCDLLCSKGICGWVLVNNHDADDPKLSIMWAAYKFRLWD